MTLASLGITSIDLTPSGSGQTFGDGSAITGTTTFTRSDGTTGTVGDAVLASETESYVITRQPLPSTGDTSRELITATHDDGSIAFRELVVTSFGGRFVSTHYDDDGNGTYDRSQLREINPDGPNGARVETVSNFNADGSLANKTITTTSADGKSVVTTIDQDGDGVADQSQSYARYSNGSSATATSQYSANGTILAQTLATSSANGLIKTFKTDANGDGVYERVRTETTASSAGNISKTAGRHRRQRHPDRHGVHLDERRQPVEGGRYRPRRRRQL